MSYIVLSFLGGSVTEGYPYDKTILQPYPELVQRELEKKYPQKHFVIYNEAKCGVTSAYGLFQCESIVRTQNPHIVFLEYALNDEPEQISVKTFESLIRKLLFLPTHPLIIVILLTTEHFNDSGVFMRAICDHYNIAYIDIAEILSKQINSGTISWNNYAIDETHPSMFGHQLIADEIVTKITHILPNKGNLFTPTDYATKYFMAPYENLKTELINQEIDQTYTIQKKCAVFWLVFIQDANTNMGTVEVVIDGHHSRYLYGKSMFSWNYPVPVLLFEKTEILEHTIRLRPIEKNKKFKIEAIGWC